MKNDTHEATGIINNKGELMIHQMERVKDWSRQWPGKKVIINLQIRDDESKAQTTYFKKHVLPQFQKGMWACGDHMSESNCLELIYQECPFCTEKGELITIEEMNQTRLNMVIEWIKWYAASNLNIFIND